MYGFGISSGLVHVYKLKYRCSISCDAYCMRTSVSALKKVRTRALSIVGRMDDSSTGSGSESKDKWRSLQNKVQNDPIKNIIPKIDFERDEDLHPAFTFDNAVRYFDAEETAVKVVLFRDPAYWCPYCQRVQVQLEHKRIPYRIRTINMRCYGPKPAYYTNLVRSGLLPAIMICPKGTSSEKLEGELITESLDIMIRLEEEFPDHNPLLPPKGTKLYEAALQLLKLERDVFGRWCQFMFRPEMFGNRAEDGFKQALIVWGDAIDKICPETPFLLGDKPSLIDIIAAPFFERYVASALYWKGIRVRAPGSEFEAVDRWLSAMEVHVQSFRATAADVYSHVHDIPPQYGTAFFSKSSEASFAQKFIDGWSSETWKIPISPLDEASLEPWPGHMRNEKDHGVHSKYYIEAASRMLRNHEKLTRFSLRGAGQLPKTVTAPLSDPDAQGPQGSETYRKSLETVVDQVIYDATSWLFDSASENTEKAGSMQLSDFALNAEECIRTDAARCIAYFRDRVGVPRDCSSPAARILRAYLNHACIQLVGVESWTKLEPELRVARA
mmetsp:Transcript_7691/g.13960  ORF Transcript_7691/g.13960 Transcript_7691/m.13960 type:complete len:555 (-) Transcript_7691:1131-2795(-)